MKITAKVYCNGKTEYGEGGERSATLTFCPDYADGRNSEWAKYTPSLNLQMNVKGSVADQFETQGRYTLTFTPDAETEA